MTPREAYLAAMNRLNHWGLLLTGRIAGTLRSEDPRSKGYRDLFQKLLALRVEVNVLTAVLVEKGILTSDELIRKFADEAELLNIDYETKFVGIRSTDAGLAVYDTEKAAEHMKGWPT